MPSAVRFGVNYTPSEGWFHHWLDFDLDSVRADLDSIAALGLDHIRVFPLWPYFQPNRALIRPRAVEQLLQLVDAAGERGLDVNVDGLQGHLSSFDFLPRGRGPGTGATCSPTRGSSTARRPICVRSPRPSPTARTSSA